MPLVKLQPRLSFDGGLTDYWSLTPDTFSAASSSIDLGSPSPQFTLAVGGVTVDTNGPSLKVRSGLRFDGTDYLQLWTATGATLAVSFAAAHSVFFWVKLDDVSAIGGAGFRQSMLGLYDGSEGIRVGCDTSVSGRFFIQSVTDTNLQVATNAAVMFSNRWNFIGYTYDGSTVAFYADGIQVSSVSASGGIGFFPGNVIGSLSGGQGAITGSLADVRLYNRVVSGAEAYAMYASQFVPQLDMPALFSPAATRPPTMGMMGVGP